MIALKKLYGDELLRLALVLSLLKADPDDFLERETQQLMAGLHGSNGSDWSLENEASTLIRPRFVHPKSLDNVLINYERELFDELNSLGRYNSYTENNDRMFNGNRPIHTYLVNVATETVAPSLAEPQSPPENVDDGVSADDNVAQEVKVDETEDAPDAVVTLSPGFLENRTASDIFNEITTRSFDVNEFLVPPDEMLLKSEDEDLTVDVKKERQEDLFDDNAIDEFVPYFATKTEKFEIGEPHSVFDQNMADLHDYGDPFDVKELRSDLEFLDGKQQPGNLEQYLLENTPLDLDSEVYDLAPLFDEVIVKRERASTSFTSCASSSGVSEMESVEADVKLEPDEGHHSGDELTQEDMDLIEVLWKQDVDMGFSLDGPTLPEAPSADKVAGAGVELKDDSKTLEEKGIEKVQASLLDDTKEDDPWAGLSYTIDTETGEYVLQGDLPAESTRFDLLEEALQLVDSADTIDDSQQPPLEGASSEMLHPAMTRHMPHHLHHYHNQRWQDLASLLTIPPPPEQYQHYHHPQHTHNISAHGAAGYTPNYPIATHAHVPVPEKHPDTYGASAPPLDGAYKVESHHHPQQHDGLYYQNTTAEAMGNNSEGFLQSILNDEDLQLMDMAMNEGMYTMRILDGGATSHHPHPPPIHNHTHMMMTERDSASDSAVSSMGSERVPSLSDGEWCDGSDSAQEFHSSKFRPYDNSSFARDRGSGSQPQKKHHMFGKRCFQEQPPQNVESPARAHSVIKYECAEQTAYADTMHLHNQFARVPPAAPPHMPPPLELNAHAHAHNAHALLQPGVPSPRYYAAPERVRHNHTYSAPPAPPADARAATRDKRVRRLTEGSMSDAGSTASHGHMSRDEKRAKALGIPLEVQEIINLPMDEFNERLSKHDLSEAQLSLIRDIRRRGKNKVAAQNCRKRKLDQITSLADEVRTVRDRKQRTLRDRQTLSAERQRVKERFAALYRHVFQHLRDSEGRALSSAQYSLQQAADGNVVLVPKMPHHADQSMNRTADDEMDRKAKSFDQ